MVYFGQFRLLYRQAQHVADTITLGEDVALVDSETGEIMGTMTVSEKYSIDKNLECQEVFRTTDPAHPGVKMVMEQGDSELRWYS
jgi:sulfate adenylyltransferase